MCHLQDAKSPPAFMDIIRFVTVFFRAGDFIPVGNERVEMVHGHLMNAPDRMHTAAYKISGKNILSGKNEKPS